MEIETKKYYNASNLRKCAEFVKDFAHRNDLILQGGQSLDYAFRLHGKKLYEDYAIPDYDFVSQDSVNLTYKLFEEVAKFMFPRSLEEPQSLPISVTNGLHITTTKVLIYRDSIADITYIPPSIFELYELSALNYNNMMVRHPFIQYIDTHRSLSHPYENVMMETVLHRWKKDFERFRTTLTMYDPSNKNMVNSFISKYNKKSLNGPPKLSKMGTGRIPKGDGKKYETSIQPENRYKLYQEFPVTEDKEILPYGCVCGELAFLIYYDIYSTIVGKKKRFQKYIKGKANEEGFGLSYTGSHYFNNSYITTDDDVSIIFGHKPVLAKHQTQTTSFMDVLPERIISEGFEFLKITHKIGYQSIDLHKIDSGFPRVILKVVSLNYLAVYVAVMWMIFKHDMYLSMYLKILRMMKKIYDMDTEECLQLYPSVVTYGEEIPVSDEMHSTRPKTLFINQYNSPLEEISKIEPFEYPEYYNRVGV